MKSLKTLAMIFLLLGQTQVFAAETPASEAPKAGPGQPGEGSDYIVGPGDGLQIFVYRNQDLSVNVTVRPDGKISIPSVEDEIKAIGVTPSQLARLIEKMLAEYIIEPQVTVNVVTPLSVFSRVTVIGQVVMPQFIPYHQGMTAMEVVLAVGGLTAFANGNKSKIIRKNASGKAQDIPVKLADLIKKGRIDEDVPMKPGDVLSVPESRL